MKAIDKVIAFVMDFVGKGYAQLTPATPAK
jgi:hypothetical protein